MVTRCSLLGSNGRAEERICALSTRSLAHSLAKIFSNPACLP
jgi:hypothetical protein